MSNEIDDIAGKLGRSDRDYFSYTRDSNGKVCKRVTLCDQPISTNSTIVGDGDSVNTYAEILSLAGLATSDVVLYTVPVGKKLKLKRVDFSGCNKATFAVKLNNITQAKAKTYYTDFNGVLVFIDLLLIAGDIVKLVVENNSNSTSDFNGNLQGKLLDA